MRKTPNYLKFILITLGGLVIFLVVINVVFSSRPEVNKQNLPTDNIISKNLISYLKKEIPTKPQINDHSPILGNPDAPITIFEFSSFACNYGREVQPVISQILKKYPDQVKLVWKDLPLENIYPKANLMHQAARCAKEQNSFWAYHDLILGHQDLNQEKLVQIAEELGLNKNQFTQCLENQEIQKIIDQDVAEANYLLIPGAPYFYIGNQELMGNVSLKDFEQIINLK